MARSEGSGFTALGLAAVADLAAVEAAVGELVRAGAPALVVGLAAAGLLTAARAVAAAGVPTGTVLGVVLTAVWAVAVAGAGVALGLAGAERILGGARRLREPLPVVGALGGAETRRLVVRGGVSGFGLSVFGPSSRGGALGNGTPRPVRFEGGPERRAGSAGGRERASAAGGAATAAGEESAAGPAGATTRAGAGAATGLEGGGGFDASTCDGGSRPATS